MRGYETYHRINEFHAVVFRDIVRSSDHHTDGLSIELLRAESCEKTDTKDNRVKKDPVVKFFLATSAGDGSEVVHIRFHTKL